MKEHVQLIVIRSSDRDLKPDSPFVRYDNISLMTEPCFTFNIPHFTFIIYVLHHITTVKNMHPFLISSPTNRQLSSGNMARQGDTEIENRAHAWQLSGCKTYNYIFGQSLSSHLEKCKTFPVALSFLLKYHQWGRSVFPFFRLVVVLKCINKLFNMSSNGTMVINHKGNYNF